MTTKIREAVSRLSEAEQETATAWNAWVKAREKRDALAFELEKLEVRTVSYTLSTVKDDTAVISAVMQAMDRVMDSGWKLASSPNRSRPYIVARRTAILAMRSFGLSYERIGDALRLDHSTVLYHNRKADRNEIAQGRVVARAAEQILSASSERQPQ